MIEPECFANKALWAIGVARKSIFDQGGIERRRVHGGGRMFAINEHDKDAVDRASAYNTLAAIRA